MSWLRCVNKVPFILSSIVIATFATSWNSMLGFTPNSAKTFLHTFSSRSTTNGCEVAR